MIRDDNTNGEDEIDSENILQLDRQCRLFSHLLDEPESGIQTADLTGYHVVILSNPGFPADDLSTIEAMRSFSQQGFGIIFQGDDITNFEPDRPLMESLTRLAFIDNGIEYEGTPLMTTKAAHTGSRSTQSLPFQVACRPYLSTAMTSTRQPRPPTTTVWSHGAPSMAQTLPSKPVITAYQP